MKTLYFFDPPTRSRHDDIVPTVSAILFIGRTIKTRYLVNSLSNSIVSTREFENLLSIKGFIKNLTILKQSESQFAKILLEVSKPFCKSRFSRTNKLSRTAGRQIKREKERERENEKKGEGGRRRRRDARRRRDEASHWSVLAVALWRASWRVLPAV